MSFLCAVCLRLASDKLALYSTRHGGQAHKPTPYSLHMASTRYMSQSFVSAFVRGVGTAYRLPGVSGSDDVVLGEHGHLRVVVLANAGVLVDAQVHVYLRHARPHLQRKNEQGTQRTRNTSTTTRQHDKKANFVTWIFILCSRLTLLCFSSWMAHFHFNHQKVMPYYYIIHRFFFFARETQEEDVSRGVKGSRVKVETQNNRAKLAIQMGTTSAKYSQDKKDHVAGPSERSIYHAVSGKSSNSSMGKTE